MTNLHKAILASAMLANSCAFTEMLFPSNVQRPTDPLPKDLIDKLERNRQHANIEAIRKAEAKRERKAARKQID